MFKFFTRANNMQVKLDKLNDEAILTYIQSNLIGVPITDFIKVLKPLAVTVLKRICTALTIPCSLGDSRIHILQRIHVTLNNPPG